MLGKKKGKGRYIAFPFLFTSPSEGFEPPTPALGRRCSIQLNYEGIRFCWRQHRSSLTLLTSQPLNQRPEAGRDNLPGIKTEQASTKPTTN